MKHEVEILPMFEGVHETKPATSDASQPKTQPASQVPKVAVRKHCLGDELRDHHELVKGSSLHQKDSLMLTKPP